MVGYWSFSSWCGTSNNPVKWITVKSIDLALKYFRIVYCFSLPLYDTRFTNTNDHDCLVHTFWIEHWMIHLMSYTFTICYKLGSLNCVYYLSQSNITPWNSTVYRMAEQYIHFVYINVHHGHSIHNEIILFRNEIVISASLQTSIIPITHEREQGIVRTKQYLRQKAWWPGINKIVEDFI